MKNYGLNYDAPADKWLSAMPLGNGHIGVMIYGDTDKETLSLNDDTLWSGYQRDYTKSDFKINLDAVRKLMLDGERLKAQDIIELKMLGRFTQAYLPLGNIEIESEQGDITDYKRNLVFATGVATISYKKDGDQYNTTCFCSYPHDVMVYHVRCSNCFSFSVDINSQLKNEKSVYGGSISIIGKAPSDIIIGDVYNFYSDGNIISYEEEEKSITFKSMLKVITDGTIRNEEKLQIKDCCYATLYYTSATSFKYEDVELRCYHVLDESMKLGYKQLLDNHISDFSRLYKSVQVDFGANEKPTSETYANGKKGAPDGYDIAKIFQYGRYLLISSSRKGTQPANLQGIWNKDLIPPWWCNYTLNINLQMNYWLVERANLSECASPLFDFIKRLCISGKKTATENYKMNGFVAHHQSDIWAHTTPVGFTDKREKDSASWGMWNMSGPWLCMHMYEYYLHNGDGVFLNEIMYPIFKECAIFLFDLLIEVKSKLENFPSTSPENIYINDNGEKLSICMTSAMDIGILSEFFKVFADLSTQVGSKKFAEKANIFAVRLKKYQVKNGRLLEWDQDFEEKEKGHRHFSMLYGLYPYAHLLKDHKNEAQNALNYRLENESGSTGWSAVWTIALLARLNDREKTGRYIVHFMQHHIHENLFGAHPSSYFQIDANFGFTSAICELLIQDYDGIIRILPAIPDVLKSGKAMGLRIKGGHKIDIVWGNKKLVSMSLEAGFEHRVRISINDCSIICEQKKITLRNEAYGISFEVKRGKIYKIMGESL